MRIAVVGLERETVPAGRPAGEGAADDVRAGLDDLRTVAP